MTVAPLVFFSKEIFVIVNGRFVVDVCCSLLHYSG